MFKRRYVVRQLVSKIFFGVEICEPASWKMRSDRWRCRPTSSFQSLSLPAWDVRQSSVGSAFWGTRDSEPPVARPPNWKCGDECDRTSYLICCGTPHTQLWFWCSQRRTPPTFPEETYPSHTYWRCNRKTRGFGNRLASSGRNPQGGSPQHLPVWGKVVQRRILRTLHHRFASGTLAEDLCITLIKVIDRNVCHNALHIYFIYYTLYELRRSADGTRTWRTSSCRTQSTHLLNFHSDAIDTSFQFTLGRNSYIYILPGTQLTTSRWRPMKQSPMCQFFISRQEGIFWLFRYYFSICDGFNDNSWHSHSLLILSRRAFGIFFRNFHPYLYQKWGSKGQKTWFKNFSSWKTRDLAGPKERGAAWCVLSDIRCDWWGSKLVNWLERRLNQIDYKI